MEDICKKELIIYDMLNEYKFYVLQENGFVNVTKICNDYNVNFETWKNEFYEPLHKEYLGLIELCSLQQRDPIIYYHDSVYLEISLAFHFIYWVSLKLGLGFCANIIPFLCEYFKE